MTVLSALQTDNAIQLDKDVLGGFRNLESALYDSTIKLAWLHTADSGALALDLTLETDTGALYNERIYMTSGTAKGGRNYFTKEDGSKEYLPGFKLCNALALLTLKQEIGNVETEDKVIKLYSYEQQKEVPTTVKMFTGLIGQRITAGILKVVENKTKKNDTTGKYDPINEERTRNEIDKFFRIDDGMTVAELAAQATVADFKDQWDTKWTGNDKNTFKPVDDTGKPGAPAAPQGSSAAANLFT